MRKPLTPSGLVCRILGHDVAHDDAYSLGGRHYGVKTCKRCGEYEITWTGPIYPGKAVDPEAAERYVVENEDYEPPQVFR